ncbi:hypothetical protein MTO96_013607 [Rhipicephalus appendiculatus]
MRRPALAALLLCLLPSGVTVPVWCDIGRALITLFAGDPGDGIKFGQDALGAPGLGGIWSALSSQQTMLSIMVWLGWFIFLAVAAGGLGIVGARFAKKCGGERLQVISPEYDDYYQYYCISVSLTGVALIITAVALFLSKSDMGSAVSDAYDNYASAVTLLKGISAGGGEKDKGKDKKPEEAPTKLRQIVETLNTRFRDDFGEYVKRRVAMDSGLPSRSVLSECREDARSLVRSLSSEGQRNLAALFKAVGRRCGQLERSRQVAYGSLARAVEDATVAQRKQLLRKVRQALERAEERVRMMAQSVGGLDTPIGALASYESDGGAVSWISFLTGVPMLLVVVITLVAPIVAIAGMGIAAQDHDLRPTIRSTQSNTGGLMLVYSAAAGLVGLIISSYIATQLYLVAAAAEVYVCEPYHSKNFKPLDQMSYALWTADQRGAAWAGFVPSEILSKCQSGSVSDLQAPSWAAPAPGGGGNETKKEGPDKKEGDKKPSVFRLSADLLRNASAVRDSGAAVRALVDALGQLPKQLSLHDAADQLTRKWRPLVEGNVSGEDPLTASVGRYYSEYMSDAAKRLRWASAEMAEQGGGCQPAFQTLNAALLLFCDTFVAGAEGYWLAHVLAFVLLLCFGPICLGMANHFLVMENYSLVQLGRETQCTRGCVQTTKLRPSSALVGAVAAARQPGGKLLIGQPRLRDPRSSRSRFRATPHPGAICDTVNSLTCRVTARTPRAPRRALSTGHVASPAATRRTRST